MPRPSDSTRRYILTEPDIARIQREVDDLFSRLQADVPRRIAMSLPKCLSISIESHGLALDISPSWAAELCLNPSGAVGLVEDARALLEGQRIHERVATVERVRAFLRNAEATRVRTTPEIVFGGERAGIYGLARSALAALIEQRITVPEPVSPFDFTESRQSTGPVETNRAPTIGAPSILVLSSKASSTWHTLKPGSVRTKGFNMNMIADWVDENPGDARRVFDDWLLDVFEYNLRVIRCLEEEAFSSGVPGELRSWSELFSFVTHGFDNPRKRPFYKIYPRQDPLPEELRRFWYLPDGITPRVYDFEELAHNPKEYVRFDDYDYTGYPATLGTSSPNIGPQYRDDDGILLSLSPGSGFNDKGLIAFIAPNHLQLDAQARLLRR
jgi:hypothetical protein